jgi:flagellar hook assembly protein FlgD
MHFVSYEVAFGAGDSPEIWTSIDGIQSSQISALPLGYWTLSSNDSSVTPVPNGLYTLKVTVIDKAGNVSVDTVLVTVDNMTLTTITESQDTLDLGLGEIIDIGFAINLPGTVTLKIYSAEQGVNGVPIRTISQAFGSAGSHSISWDGRDDAGIMVPNEAYLYILEASDGTRLGQYTPTEVPATDRIDSGFNTTYPNFNGYTNDHWKANVTLNQPGRVQLILTLQSLGNKKIYPDGAGRILEAGAHTLTWDGRDPDTGDLYMGTFQVQINLTGLPTNTLRVTGNDRTPIVTGTVSVEVKTDPYLVYLSYGQVTKFAYRLEAPESEVAWVQVKLLPPGVYDPADPRATLIDQGFKGSGDYDVQWDGITASDPNKLMREIGEDGAHTFAIEAISSTGQTTLVRSVINAYQ